MITKLHSCTVDIRFNIAWNILGLKNAKDIYNDHILYHYSEENRKYHNLNHINHCINTLVLAINSGMTPVLIPEIIIALFFHDLIYDTHKLDNEDRSAIITSCILRSAGASMEQSSRICAMIRLSHHKEIYEVLNFDQMIMLDVDLSILGEKDEEFFKYDTQIRQEYSWIPDDIYNFQRINILQKFLDRKSIYHTQYFIDSYESKARDNLNAAIKRCKKE